MSDTKDLKFIKEFSNITITNISKGLNIDKSNIYKKGKYADKVKKEIDKKIIKLYDNYVNSGDEDE